MLVIAVQQTSNAFSYTVRSNDRCDENCFAQASAVVCCPTEMIGRLTPEEITGPRILCSNFHLLLSSSGNKMEGIVVSLVLVSLVMSLFFSTPSRADYVGVHIVGKEYIEEGVDIGNTVSFYPKSVADITEHLIEINNRSHAVFSVQAFFWQDEKGFVYEDTRFLLEAIAKSGHTMDVIVFFDEPLWVIRRACWAGNQLACKDVAQGFPETLRNLTQIATEIQSYGIKVAHTEAHTEVYYQYAEQGKLGMVYTADFIGSICYGPVDGCGGQFGVPRLPQVNYIKFVVEQMHLNNSDAKLALVPGVAIGMGGLADWNEAVTQILGYRDFYLQHNFDIGAFIGFGWNSFGDLTGARDGLYPSEIMILFNDLHTQ
ncbi:MAG: hypothetical protein MRK00_04625 [Nitrosomonas sp.]|nr:hypothetical protein [Nitrosomonas sp.]